MLLRTVTPAPALPFTPRPATGAERSLLLTHSRQMPLGMLFVAYGLMQQAIPEHTLLEAPAVITAALGQAQFFVGMWRTRHRAVHPHHHQITLTVTIEILNPLPTGSALGEPQADMPVIESSTASIIDRFCGGVLVGVGTMIDAQIPNFSKTKFLHLKALTGFG